MADPIEDLGIIGVNNPRTSYNPTAGVVQLPGQSGAPGPYAVDPGAAVGSYLSAFTPELMDQLFKLEQGYGPKFTDLDLAALRQRIEGTMPLIGTSPPRLVKSPVERPI